MPLYLKMVRASWINDVNANYAFEALHTRLNWIFTFFVCIILISYLRLTSALLVRSKLKFVRSNQNPVRHTLNDMRSHLVKHSMDLAEICCHLVYRRHKCVKKHIDSKVLKWYSTKSNIWTTNSNYRIQRISIWLIEKPLNFPLF